MRSAGLLRLHFRVVGDLARVRIPARSTPRVVQGLWRHTCLEAFLAVDGRPEYHELNLSPSGEWMVHAFRGYRDVEPIADEALAPQITSRFAGDAFELDAEIALERLSLTYRAAPLAVGLCAVIEDQSGALSYWALRHPRDQPDFHDAASFALRLESPPA